MSLILESNRYGKVDFGPIFCAPFIRGFFGHMHWPLYFLYLLGLTWRKTGFAAKTVTLYSHQGNVDLDDNGWTWSLWVKAIYYNFQKNCFVNAFGLSNPGLLHCLRLNIWQKMDTPLIISLTSLKDTQQERFGEVERIKELLLQFLPGFKSPIAIVWNCGCPNEGVYRNMDSFELIQEIKKIFSQLKQIDVPIIFGCNALMPSNVIHAIQNDVDAFWIGNTIPVGNICLDWKKIFKDGVSPLIQRGMKLSGGYSGPEIFDFTREKVVEIRQQEGVETPIIAGGGIRSWRQVKHLSSAEADAVFIGSIVLRPWRMRSIIRAAHRYFS